MLVAAARGQQRGAASGVVIRDEACAGPRCTCLARRAAGATAGGSDCGEATWADDAAFFRGWPRALEGEEAELGESLLAAVDAGDLAEAKAALDRFAALSTAGTARELANVRRPAHGNDFPLAIAAAADDPPMLDLLIDQGCCLCCQTDAGETALHVAARMGRVDAVDRLLERGAASQCFESGVDGLRLLDHVLLDLHIELEDKANDAGEESEQDRTIHCGNLQQVAMMLLNVGAKPERATLSRLAVTRSSLQSRLATILFCEDQAAATRPSNPLRLSSEDVFVVNDLHEHDQERDLEHERGVEQQQQQQHNAEAPTGEVSRPQATRPARESPRVRSESPKKRFICQSPPSVAPVSSSRLSS